MTLNFAKSAVAAAVLGLGSLAANASTIFWGEHDAVEFGGLVVAGNFTDYFTFTLTPPATVTSTTVASNNLNFLNIVGGQYSLWNSGSDGVGGDADTLVTTFNFDGTTGSTFNSAVLNAGNYFYKVEGNANGIAGGIYVITSTLAPVPEPTTYALLLAGLGVVGFVARRRKSV